MAAKPSPMIAALAMHKDPESLIICNGYKDSAYIRMAMLGRKLGKKLREQTAGRHVHLVHRRLAVAGPPPVTGEPPPLSSPGREPPG